jgi:hypothetical protein
MHLHPTPSFQPNIADVADDIRDKAVKRTAETLRMLVEVRRSLELPVDQLPIVIETYGKMVLALLAEADRQELAKRTQRLPLKLRSEDHNEPVKIRPGKTFKVLIHSQVLSFRPEDLAIHGDRSRWLVHDIMVGNRSQILGKHRGPVPGTEFGPGGILEHLRFDTLQISMDFVLDVEYVGPEADGEVFEATVVGISVAF